MSWGVDDSADRLHEESLLNGLGRDVAEADLGAADPDLEADALGRDAAEADLGAADPDLEADALGRDAAEADLDAADPT